MDAKSSDVQVMTAKQAAILAFVFPTIALVLTVAVRKCDGWSILLYALTYFCFIPIMTFGLYMSVTGNGSRWINGFDWQKIGPDRAPDYAAYIGLWIAIGSAVMMIGLAAVLWNFIFMIVLLLTGLVVMLLPNALIAWKRGQSKIPKRRHFTVKGAWALTLAIMIVATVPTGFILAENSNESTVVVTLEEDDFTVEAPMFDHTFAYSDVDSLELIEDFDHGVRISGYATGTISSGHYRNGTLGDYELASYTHTSSCIVIFVDGSAYAFNQISNGDTMALYEELQERTGLR